MWNKNIIQIVPVFLIVIVGLLVYINSLNYEFVWDDDILIKQNVYIQNWSNIFKLFTENISAGAGKKGNFYRPLQMVSYTLDYSLYGLNVRGYHLTNILLHILTALSMYGLINLLFNNRALSFLTSLFFIIHPIHTEAVTYISGRSDSLALLFMLLSLIFYIRQHSCRHAKFFILTVLSYAAALLSRESCLIFPALIIIYHYIFRKELKLKKFLPILSIAIIYVLLRITLLSFSLSSPKYSTTLFERIPGVFVALTNYIKILLLPFDLHMEYGNRLFSFIDPKTLSGLAVFLFLIIYSIRKRDTNRVVSFAILWFFVGLLPISNAYPLDAYMAEHWLYLPSVGFFLIFATVLDNLYNVKRFRILSIIFIAIFAIFYSNLTIKQNTYWKEPEAFYKRTLKYAPKSPGVHYNLGNTYKDQGKNEQAITMYKSAIEYNPDYIEAYNNLGIAYSQMGRKEEAVDSFKKAIELNVEVARIYNNLGNAYREVGKHKEALSTFEKAIEIQPDFAEAYYNLGNTYKSIGRNKEAIEVFKKAIENSHNYAKAYNSLAIAYRDIGNMDEAITSLKRIIEIDPNNASAYNNLGSAYYVLGKQQDALTFLKKAIGLESDYAEAHRNLSLAYFYEGQYKLSVEHYNKASKLGLQDRNLQKALQPYFNISEEEARRVEQFSP